MLILQIFYIAAPLLLITLGALFSEYAGRFAMFMECIINMGAFFCYAFTIFTHNAFLGSAFSVLLCTIIVFAFEKIATFCKANMFLTSLALNLLFSASPTFLSAVIFGTRGVLYSADFTFSSSRVKIITSIIALVFCILMILFLTKTNAGLKLKVTGSSEAVLKSQGVNVNFYKSLSWIVAAFSGALCGSMLALRISSYVPGISSGRGWTALAAVFLGKRNPLFIAVGVIVFALAEYASVSIQNIPMFAALPSSLLLALPYLLALILILAVPQKWQE